MRLSFNQVPAVVTGFVFVLGFVVFYFLHAKHTYQHLEQQTQAAIVQYLQEQETTLQDALQNQNLAFLRNWVTLKAERADVHDVMILSADLTILASARIAEEGEQLSQVNLTLLQNIQLQSDASIGEIRFLPTPNSQNVGVLMALPPTRTTSSIPQNNGSHSWLYLTMDIEGTYWLVNEIILSDVVLYIASILLCVSAIFFMLRKRLHRRLENVIEVLQHYAAGNGQVRASISKDIEFKALESLLNTTLDALEQQKSLNEYERNFSEQIINSTTDAIISIDGHGLIVMVNERALQMFEYEHSAQLLGQSLQILIPPVYRATHDKHVFQANQSASRHGVINRIRQIEGLKRNGETFPIEINIVENIRGNQRVFTAFVKDNSEQLAYRRSIEQLAYFDKLTGSYNLNGFRQYLDKLEFPCQLLLVNTDSIRTVNDSMGFQAGDELIKKCARILSQLPLTQLTLCRISGGEFILSCKETPLIIHQQLPAFLSQEIQIGKRRYQLSYCCSFVSFLPQDDFDDKHRQLELAMRQAKQKGRASLMEVDVEWISQIQRNALLCHQLEEAIRREELYFVFQPKFCARSRQPKSAEALIRWQADGHPVSPAVFIPLAEQSHLMPAMDRLVIDRACRTIREWLDQGLHVLPLSINLSARYLCEERTIACIFEKVGEYDVPPHLLEIEVTEYSLITEFDQTAHHMRRLQKAGIGIAIDDYGTGHSNLEAVLSLPVQHLKIDQSFIRVGMGSARGRAILENIMQLAQSLQMVTTAEGVETQEQLIYLSHAGCDFIQGFLLSRPLPQRDFEQLLRDQDNFESLAVNP